MELTISVRGYSQEDIAIIEQHVTALYHQPLQQQFLEYWQFMNTEMCPKFSDFWSILKGIGLIPRI
jgi:hypothetical protein